MMKRVCWLLCMLFMVACATVDSVEPTALPVLPTLPPPEPTAAAAVIEQANPTATSIPATIAAEPTATVAPTNPTETPILGPTPTLDWTDETLFSQQVYQWQPSPSGRYETAYAASGAEVDGEWFVIDQLLFRHTETGEERVIATGDWSNGGLGGPQFIVYQWLTDESAFYFAYPGVGHGCPPPDNVGQLQRYEIATGEITAAPAVGLPNGSETHFVTLDGAELIITEVVTGEQKRVPFAVPDDAWFSQEERITDTASAKWFAGAIRWDNQETVTFVVVGTDFTNCPHPTFAEYKVDAATGEIIPPLLYLSDPAQFAAENRNPLTGEVVDDPVLLNRRPILCKISNSPKQWVLPQSGLNAADMVFEHFAEGVVTRFTALFYGETPADVGPVRSARKIDLELPLMYDGALCFSGGSSGQGVNRGVQDLVAETQFSQRVLYPGYPGYYRTGADKPWEHTYYTDLTAAWDYLDSIDQNQRPTFATQMAFSEKVPVSADNRTISVKYGKGGDLVEWVYDESIDKYRRWTNGDPVIDALDGEQVTASNVIIIMAPHIVDRNICETQTATECLAFSTEIQIWGGGFAQFFRNGRQVNGSWYRRDREQAGEMFTFEIVGGEQDGQMMPLAIGNTWFQVVPYEYIETTIDVSADYPTWYDG